MSEMRKFYGVVSKHAAAGVWMTREVARNTGRECRNPYQIHSRTQILYSEGYQLLNGKPSYGGVW